MDCHADRSFSGKFGYLYRTNVQGNNGKRIFVIPQMNTHPGVDFCQDCSKLLPEEGRREQQELCQRNSAILLHFYDAENGLDSGLAYSRSAYFLVYTRNIWNAVYTNAATHCAVDVRIPDTSRTLDLPKSLRFTDISSFRCV